VDITFIDGGNRRNRRTLFSNVYLNYQILNNKHSEIKEYAHVHLNDMYCLYLEIYLEIDD
jgi:hypothetical protein